MSGMRVRGWSGRSGLAKVDLYTRGTVYLLVWTALLALTLLMLTRPVRLGAHPFVAVGAPLLAVANGVASTLLARRAMDAYLGQGRVPPRLAGGAAVITALTAGTALWLGATVGMEGTLPMALSTALVPFLTAHCLIVRRRTTVLIHAGLLALLGVLVPLTGRSTEETLFTLGTVAFSIGWLAFTARVSMWVLAVMWELREARDVQARLAVAEERLRFGRDLHDVLGRNLAVIALKSELAVQLARRGAERRALEQMAEVQRIARESQREVRDVVRGYRGADLRTELDGARGVLGAAGIDCTIESPGDGPPVGALPVEIQSALAWVVREATTNVLRHGDAAHCAIALTTGTGTAALTVENDGVPGRTAVGAPGSGLTGLRERLAALGGTLEAGPAPDARFRLTARVPLPAGGAPDVPGREPGRSGHPDGVDVTAATGVPGPADPTDDQNDHG
ncbi:two-component sensor histidine kinase [Streptomyces tirandamycinicus]|uniref:Two-component sensor histidine kinase n=2 Tax=Streptomyces tirandamycinicus TaxID=2174846 RepID=A0A2S1STT5_9ACTN|nr:sensor histidine kinase [Streptomyces tirandamycinicus]AWI29811.1 two-component sensor histidine kinase [Streptomyces tirandamycinicus]